MKADIEYTLAPWGRSVWVITLLTSCLVLMECGLFLTLGIGCSATNKINAVIYLIIAGLGPLILFFIVLFSPRGYRITDSAVVVSRLGPNIVIPLNEIESIQEADASLFKGALRVMGCGGAFGYFGRFTAPAIGPYKAYVVRTDHIVLVHQKHKNIVAVSPADISGFIEQVRTRITTLREQQ